MLSARDRRVPPRARLASNMADERSVDEEPLVPSSSSQQSPSSSIHPPHSWPLLLTLPLLLLLLLLLLTLWLVRPSLATDGRVPIDLNRLLSTDARSSQLIRKIANFSYQRYDTVVVLMRARTQLHPAYQTAHDLIGTHFPHILTPLPVDSLHVTLSGVFDRSKAASLTAYNDLIRTHHPRLERALWRLAQLPPAVPPLTFAVLGVITNGTGVVVHLRPKRMEDERLLASLVEVAASGLGPVYHAQQRWHVTLAYKRPSMEWVGQGQLDQIEERLMAAFAGVDVVVERPTLCVSPTVASCQDLG